MHLKRWQMVLGLITFLLAVAWGFRLLPWQWPGTTIEQTAPGPPDPRLVYKGPYKNIHPDVRYVGDAACASCHSDISLSYRDNPMGRSLAPVGKLKNPPLDEKHRNPFKALNALFRVTQNGDRVFHDVSQHAKSGSAIYQRSLEVQFAVGSGNHGYSYLMDCDGFLFMSPVGWYSRKAIWDLSPGFHSEVMFGSPVVPGCLFCHANRALHLEGSFNHYERPVFSGHAIGCERCHGPGELHVKEGGVRDQDTQIDRTIVNPRHLTPLLKESVCEQCHLEGAHRVTHFGQGLYDFRPGLPLSEFWSVFIDEGQQGQQRKIVNHVEQMYLSKCYEKTEGSDKLHCISCHNPHEKPSTAQRVDYYRNKCLNCHPETMPKGRLATSCALSKKERTMKDSQDSCISCHMPAYALSEVVHTAFTDHRIVRDKEAHQTAQGSSAAASTNLVQFHSRKLDLNDPTLARDYAVALVHLAAQQDSSKEHYQRALPLLDAAVKRYPKDWEAWECKGIALKALGQMGKALTAFEEVLAQQPARETALVGAAISAQGRNDLDLALSYWSKAVTANGWMPQYRANLAILSVIKEDWPTARTQGAAWLQLAPHSADARKLRITCLLHDGQLEQAKAEFTKIRDLAPPDLLQLEQWFAKELARKKEKN